MAIPAYLWLKDEQGNEISGSVSVSGREGSIEVLEFNHNIYIPTDNDTGEQTGTRKHGGISIMKAFDASSPTYLKPVVMVRNCNRLYFVGTKLMIPARRLNIINMFWKA